MTSEGEAVCLSLELWKHGENEFKYNVLWSCSLMVEINYASINSISSADPGVINIGESHALSSVAACRRFLKVQFSTLPPFFIEFKKILKKSCQSLGQNSGTKYQLYWLPDCILEQPSLDALNCLIQRTFFTLKIPLSLINKLEISCSKSLQGFWRIDQCGGMQGLSFLLRGNTATSYAWRIATEGFISTKEVFPVHSRWQQQTGFPLSIHTSSTYVWESQKVLVSTVLRGLLFWGRERLNFGL